MNNLRRIDVNLLVTLQALLLEKHISRAAARLHRSQPAVSHALAHLRRVFNDPLLVRSGKHLELSAKARELLPTLSEALEQLEGLLGAPDFDPQQTQRVFRLAMSDYGAQVLLPKLVESLRKLAPGIALNVTQASREAMLLNVIEGESDIALGVFPMLSSEALRHHVLFTETFVCLADKNSVPIRGGLSLEAWLARPHATVSMHPGSENEVDLALRQSGLSRKIMVSLPHWSVANELVCGTDLILTVARRNLKNLNPQLRVFEPPVAIKPFEYLQVWHKRRDDDAAHQWLRQLILQIAQQPLPAEILT